MGKRLIIKGADFSANKIPQETTWFLDGFSENMGSPFAIDPSVARIAPGDYQSLQGKVVNVAKLKVATPGLMTISVASAASAGASFTEERVLDLSQHSVGDIVEIDFNAISIPSNGVFVISAAGDTGANYGGSITGGPGFILRIGKPECTGAVVGIGTSLCISIGYKG